MQKTKGNILIVDDNPEALIALEMYLGKHFEEITTVKNPNRIPNIIHTQNIDVIILDMNFSAGISSGNEGLFWLNEILKIDPVAAVVLITAYGDIELAVKGIKKGAHDFITKPWENEKLLATVEASYRLRKSRLEVHNLKNRQKHLSANIATRYHMFRGTSDSMLRIYEMVEKVAKTDANILILGENGTGKELLAREIHKQSGLDVFIPVDINALPATLVESELFGYQKGAFTGAQENKPGRFELANEGTLFLDEIGNISFELQSKLLTVLQTREINRIGSNKTLAVKFRLISATNSSIYNMVDKSHFREDLLYRINTIQIEIPPLRERTEDIEGLTRFFLSAFGNKYNKHEIKLSNAAIKKLRKYAWPGNIRELEHIIEKAMILADASVLHADDIQFYTDHKSRDPKKQVFSLSENERIVIKEAMRECNGNLSETADRLGITRATLYRKIKKYDL